MSKALQVFTCIFTDLPPNAGAGVYNVDNLPTTETAMWNAASEASAQLHQEYGTSAVMQAMCYTAEPQFKDFLSSVNLSRPFMAIMGTFEGGQKKVYTTRKASEGKLYIRAMFLGEFGGTGLPTNPGEGDGGWGEGDGGLLCKLLPPLCALGFLPWLAASVFTTYKAVESRSPAGKTMWAIPAYLFWQGFFARGGVKQIQWWIKKAGIGGISAKVVNLYTFTEKDILSIQDYQLTTKSGRAIRKATKVVFKNGHEILFTEKMPRGEAIKNALYQANK